MRGRYPRHPCPSILNAVPPTDKARCGLNGRARSRGTTGAPALRPVPQPPLGDRRRIASMFRMRKRPFRDVATPFRSRAGLAVRPAMASPWCHGAANCCRTSRHGRRLAHGRQAGAGKWLRRQACARPAPGRDRGPSRAAIPRPDRGAVGTGASSTRCRVIAASLPSATPRGSFEPHPQGAGPAGQDRTRATSATTAPRPSGLSLRREDRRGAQLPRASAGRRSGSSTRSMLPLPRPVPDLAAGSVTIWRASDRPRPLEVPARAGSASVRRENGVNSSRWRSFGMPGPRSQTRSCQYPGAPALQATSTSLPGAYFIALPIRLPATCRRTSSSIATTPSRAHPEEPDPLSRTAGVAARRYIPTPRPPVDSSRAHHALRASRGPRLVSR